MIRILVIHGPNLNLLGERPKGVYGRTTLAGIDRELAEQADALGFAVTSVQTNHEGEIVDLVQGSRGVYAGVLLNPGGYTHTSVAIRDAIEASPVPVVEVHLTNLHAREPFRSRSLTAAPAAGVVTGFGAASYTVGLCALAALLRGKGKGGARKAGAKAGAKAKSPGRGSGPTGKRAG
jgi:3-dehydroquinate dehydratase-2